MKQVMIEGKPAPRDAFDDHKVEHVNHGSFLLTLIRADIPFAEVWGAKVQSYFAGWFEGTRNDALKIAIANVPTEKTGKVSLLDELNAARAQRGLPPMKPVEVDALKLTKSKLEQLVYELDTPAFDVRTKKAPPTTVELLARLNVCRTRKGDKRLKAWKGSRAQLSAAIALCENDRSGVIVTKCPPAVAEGSGTTRFRTDMHKNKVLKVLKSDQRKHAASIKQMRKATADAAAAHWGFTPRSVFRYMVFKDTQTLALDDATRDAIKKWIGAPGKAHAAPTPKNDDVITPAHIAQALNKDGRAVRIILRKIEKKIPKAWRAEGRWGFKKEFKDQIIKLTGGK